MLLLRWRFKQPANCHSDILNHPQVMQQRMKAIRILIDDFGKIPFTLFKYECKSSASE